MISSFARVLSAVAIRSSLSLFLLAALGIWNSPVAAQGEKPPLPTLNEINPIDLTRVGWTLIDSPVKTPAELQGLPSKGATMPSAMKISSEAGWLVMEFTTPKLSRDPAEAQRWRETLGSTLVLGDCSGSDRVFLNGKLIGETDYLPNAPNMRPRRYVISPKQIKFGMPNQLAIRIAPPLKDGAREIGLSTPMALAWLDRHDLQRRLDDFVDNIGKYYRTLYRARMAGLPLQRSAPPPPTRPGEPKPPKSLFEKVSAELMELEATISKAWAEYNADRLEISETMRDLDDLLEGAEPLRFQLEAKAVTRIRQYKNQIVRELANILQTDASNVRLRRNGYGRFGKLLNDGLPGLRHISPVSFGAVPDQEIRIHLDTLDRQDIMEIDWSHKITRVVATQDRYASDGRQLRIDEMILIYYMYASSLFPGAMLETLMGRSITLDLPYSGKDISVYQFAVAGPDYDDVILMRYFGPGAREKSASEKRAHRELMDRLKDEPRLLLIVPRVQNASPFLMVFENPNDVRLRRMPFRDDRSLLDIETIAPNLGRIVFLFPLGTNTVDARRLDRKKNQEELPAELFGAKYSEFLATFYRFGARYPIGVEEVYRVDRSRNRVDILDRFLYSNLNQELVGSFFPAILPSQVVQASQDGYPVSIANDFRLRLSIPGPEGLFYLGTCDNGSVRYSLPIPDIPERALPDVDAPPYLRELFDSHVELIASGLSPDSDDELLDVLARGRPALYQAYAMLEPEVQQELARTESAVIDFACDPDNWRRSEEPFSSIATEWTAGRIGPYYDLYYQEAANASILNSLYLTFQYSGNWSAAEKYGDFITSTIWKRLAAPDDWSWMRAGNAEHGGGSGLGDATNAVFLGARAYARIMDKLERDAESDEGYYTLARVAVPTVNRFRINEYARRNGLIGKDSIAVGWRESTGFVSAPMQGYPWPAVSLIDAEGAHPALFDFYMQYAPKDLLAYLKSLQSAWPRWYDGDYRYGRRTTYADNSGRITLPIIYGVGRTSELGEGMSHDLMPDYLVAASTNERYWWESPPVLAEAMAGGEDLWVEDWGRLRFQGAKYADGRFEVEFMALKDQSPTGEIQLHVPERPAAVYANFKKVDDFQFDPQLGTLVVPLHDLVPGIVWLAVDLKDLPAPEIAQTEVASPAALQAIELLTTQLDDNEAENLGTMEDIEIPQAGLPTTPPATIEESIPAAPAPPSIPEPAPPVERFEIVNEAESLDGFDPTLMAEIAPSQEAAEEVIAEEAARADNAATAPAATDATASDSATTITLDAPMPAADASTTSSSALDPAPVEMGAEGNVQELKMSDIFPTPEVAPAPVESDAVNSDAVAPNAGVADDAPKKDATPPEEEPAIAGWEAEIEGIVEMSDD